MDQLKHRQQNFILGLLLMLFSGLGFAGMNLFVRLTGDLPATQKLFFRNLLVFVVSLTAYLRHREVQDSKTRIKENLGLLGLRALLGTIGLLANFYAVDHLPLANASVLNKLSPFFTVIFSALFLKEHVNPSQIAGIGLAFFGVIVLNRPSLVGLGGAVGTDIGQAPQTLLPVLVAVLGGIAAGAAYTTIRELGRRGVHGSFIICFFSGVSCLIMLPTTLLHFHPMTRLQVLYMVLVGVCALAGQYGITYAYRFAPANRISIFDYSSVLFSTLLGFVFLGQVPSSATLLGIGIIFIAFLTMFLYNRKHT